MAKQDFINGGFRGKLGEVIGQRWLSQYTIRTYFKPSQPRTGSQQANRELFKQAVELANIACQYNKGVPQWVTEGKLSYNLRVAQAKTLLANGASAADALPLYRTGYTPSVTISDLAISETDDEFILSSVTWADLTDERTFSISATLYDTVLNTQVRVIYPVTNTHGLSEILSISKVGRYQYTGNTEFLGITKDDSSFNDTFIYIPPQSPTPATAVEISDLATTVDDNYTVTLSSESMANVSDIYNITVVYEVWDGMTSVKSTKSVTTTSTASTALSVTLPLDTYESMSTDCKIEVSASPELSSSSPLVFDSITVALGIRTVADITPDSWEIYFNTTAGIFGYFVNTSLVPKDAVGMLSEDDFPVATTDNGQQVLSAVIDKWQNGGVYNSSLFYEWTYNQDILSWLPTTSDFTFGFQNSYIKAFYKFINPSALWVSPSVIIGTITSISNKTTDDNTALVTITASEDGDFMRSFTVPTLDITSGETSTESVSLSNSSFSNGVITAELALSENKQQLIGGTFNLTAKGGTSTKPYIFLKWGDGWSDSSDYEYTQELSNLSVTATFSLNTNNLILHFTEGTEKVIVANVFNEILNGNDSTLTFTDTSGNEYTFIPSSATVSYGTSTNSVLFTITPESQTLSTLTEGTSLSGNINLSASFELDDKSQFDVYYNGTISVSVGGSRY